MTQVIITQTGVCQLHFEVSGGSQFSIPVDLVSRLGGQIPGTMSLDVFRERCPGKIADFVGRVVLIPGVILMSFNGGSFSVELSEEFSAWLNPGRTTIRQILEALREFYPDFEVSFPVM